MKNSVIFYDGHCALCHFWVKFVLALDKKDFFLFSPLQGQTLRGRLEDSKIKTLPDSIIVVDDKNDLHLKSDAIIFILSNLGYLSFFLAVILKLFPRLLRDSIYDFVAKFRKNVFGEKAEVCPMMSEEQRRKFLD